jgi:hypothetical protein
MTTFDDRLAAQLRALDAAIPEFAPPTIPAAPSRVRRFPVRRLVLLAAVMAAVLAIVGGATASLLMVHGSFAGEAYQYAWNHATMLGMSRTEQGYAVTLEAVYADASQMVLAVSVVDTQNRGWSGVDAFSADARFTDGAGPAWAMTQGASVPASTGAANTIWLDASAPVAPGVHSVTVTVPAIRYRDPEPVGTGDLWHEVLGSWTFTFDLPIAGGRRVNLDTAATVNGVTATAVGLFSTPTVVKVDVQWSDRGPTGSGWTSVGTAFHDGHELPIARTGTAADGIEVLSLLAGTEDPSGHWKVVISQLVGNSTKVTGSAPGDRLVRLDGPWVLEFDVPRS